MFGVLACGIRVRSCKGLSSQNFTSHRGFRKSTLEIGASSSGTEARHTRIARHDEPAFHTLRIVALSRQAIRENRQFPASQFSAPTP
jgi:hypothetical protein